MILRQASKCLHEFRGALSIDPGSHEHDHHWGAGCVTSPRRRQEVRIDPVVDAVDAAGSHPAFTDKVVTILA
jgi:hypothetical protein